MKNCGEARIGEVAEWEFQVGTDRASTRKCRGDSGGPTYLQVAPGSDFPRRVVGVTSHAYDESLCDEGGLDTRVDAYLDWLDARMRAACADGVRRWCEIPGLIPPNAGPVAVPPGGRADAGVPDTGTVIDAGLAPDTGPPDGGLVPATDAGQNAADSGGAEGGVAPDGLRETDGCRCTTPLTGSVGWAYLALGGLIVRRGRGRSRPRANRLPTGN